MKKIPRKTCPHKSFEILYFSIKIYCLFAGSGGVNQHDKIHQNDKILNYNASTGITQKSGLNSAYKTL